MVHELQQIYLRMAFAWIQTLQTKLIFRRKVRYELFSSRVRIGRTSRPFPPSKRYGRLSTHTAFQFDPATEKLQADGCFHPSQDAPVEAQHNLLCGVPRCAGEHGSITSSVICIPWLTCLSSVRLGLPWRTFTMSLPLQKSFRLLRRLRPLSRPLAFLRLLQALAV
jgi:hypothetical protein